MLSFLRRSEPSRGLVFFRGSAAHRPEEYQFLTKHGISGKLGKTNPAAHWSIELNHKQWGPATLVAFRDMPMPDPTLLEFSAGLDDEDRQALRGAGWAIGLTAPATKGEVLRDRKNFLRYMRAVMGDDALAGVDHQSQLFWTRGALDDELAHDADLDVQSIFCVHAVSDDTSGEGPVPWLHTHGLGELGAVDFDILNAHPGIGSATGADMLRAIAFAILEGVLKPGAEAVLRAPGLPIRAVDAVEFQRTASASHAGLRVPDENHSRARVVLCDPMPGFIGRLLRGSKPRPSSTLASDPEGCVVAFSGTASTLSAERARNTMALFSTFIGEFEKLRPIALAKIGCATDTGSREHPWFRVHSITASDLDVTCENDPFAIPGLKRGDRVRKPIADVSDWVMMLPIGTISPRSIGLARMIRENPERVREVVEMIEKMPDER